MSTHYGYDSDQLHITNIDDILISVVHSLLVIYGVYI